MADKARKILLSLAIGLLMNLIWNVVIFIIDTSTTASNEWFQTSLLERTTLAYSFFWLGMFLPGDPTDPSMTLALISNTILYYALSYALLSAFRIDKIDSKKILSLLIGVLMNPALLFAIFLVDPSAASAEGFPMTVFHGTWFGYMYCWSTALLPTNPLDLRAATFLPLIVNPIAYFTLSYGLLSVLTRLTGKSNKLK